MPGLRHSLPPGEILAELPVMPPVFQLTLPGAVGHQVTAATPGELLSPAVGTDTPEHRELHLHHLPEAVGAKLGRAESETRCHPEQKMKCEVIVENRSY